jgi:hypothetical protein
MTFGVMTLSIRINSVSTIGTMTLGLRTFSKMTYCVKTFVKMPHSIVVKIATIRITFMLFRMLHVCTDIPSVMERNQL